jgi:hypothetical protein
MTMKVRFGSKAEHADSQCPLSANSGHHYLIGAVGVQSPNKKGHPGQGCPSTTGSTELAAPLAAAGGQLKKERR